MISPLLRVLLCLSLALAFASASYTYEDWLNEQLNDIREITLDERDEWCKTCLDYLADDIEPPNSFGPSKTRFLKRIKVRLSMESQRRVGLRYCTQAEMGSGEDILSTCTVKARILLEQTMFAFINFIVMDSRFSANDRNGVIQGMNPLIEEIKDWKCFEADRMIRNPGPFSPLINWGKKWVSNLRKILRWKNPDPEDGPSVCTDFYFLDGVFLSLSEPRRKQRAGTDTWSCRTMSHLNSKP